jgi:hypothetical protein
MAFDERLLKQGREAKTPRVAYISTLRKQGQPSVFGGVCLREQVAENLLGRVADFGWLNITYIRRCPSVRRSPKAEGEGQESDDES